MCAGSGMRRWRCGRLDIVGGAFLADGTEAKIVTGVDDHSRYCVICQVVARPTGRAVCLAFAAALRKFGVPAEVLTDNGKQFTDRFGKGGEVLFDRICRDNGIIHRLTRPGIRPPPARSSGSTASCAASCSTTTVPFADLAAAQAAVDTWVSEYNTTRPHQSLGMASPAERFSTAAAKSEEELLPLRLPAVIAVAAGARPPASQPGGPPPPRRRQQRPALPRRPGGVRAGGPAQRQHAGRRAAVLARPAPGRDDRSPSGPAPRSST